MEKVNGVVAFRLQDHRQDCWLCAEPTQAAYWVMQDAKDKGTIDCFAATLPGKHKGQPWDPNTEWNEYEYVTNWRSATVHIRVGIPDEFTLAGFQLTDRNGTYVKSQEAVNGMPEFQRKDGRDYWICYYPPGKMWVMQSQIHKGTCDSMAVTIAGDNAPWDEASRWKESNSSACNEWHSNDLIQQWTLSSVRVLSETDLALRRVLAEAAVSPSPIRYNAHY